MSNLQNTFIKVLNREHGKKVIAWFKSQGVDTRSLNGFNTEEEGNHYIYYGVRKEDGLFDNVGEDHIRVNQSSVITLPIYGIKNPVVEEFPRLMWVKDKDKDPWKTRVVLAIKRNKAVAWSNSETIEDAEGVYSTSYWGMYKEVGELQITEVTLEEVAKLLGKDVNEIRIKK